SSPQLRRTLLGRARRAVVDRLPLVVRRRIRPRGFGHASATLEPGTDLPAWARAAAAKTVGTVRSVEHGRGATVGRFEPLEVAMLSNREVAGLLARNAVDHLVSRGHA